MVYCRSASGYASYKFVYSIGLISGQCFFLLSSLKKKNLLRNWEHLGPLFLYGHADGMNCRHLMAGIVDSRLKLWHLEFSHKGRHTFAMFSAHVLHE